MCIKEGYISNQLEYELGNYKCKEEIMYLIIGFTYIHTAAEV